MLGVISCGMVFFCKSGGFPAFLAGFPGWSRTALPGHGIKITFSCVTLSYIKSQLCGRRFPHFYGSNPLPPWDAYSENLSLFPSEPSSGLDVGKIFVQHILRIFCELVKGMIPGKKHLNIWMVNSLFPFWISMEHQPMIIMFVGEIHPLL